jgi:hypothetical protein
MMMMMMMIIIIIIDLFNYADSFLDYIAKT